VLELALVLGAVEMAFRFCNELLVVDLPEFVALIRTRFPIGRPGRCSFLLSSNGKRRCRSSALHAVCWFEFVERHGHVWKIVHESRAISAIAARPTAGVPSLTLSEPLSAKNTATFSGF